MIVLFSETKNNIEHTITSQTISCLYNLKKEFIIYDNSIQKNLVYYLNSADSRMYDGLLEYAVENKIDTVIIPFLLYPEYLYFALQNNKVKNSSLKVSFVSDLRFMTLSNARIKTFEYLFSDPNIGNIVIHTLDSNNEYFYRFFNHLQKNIHITFTPFYHKVEIVKKETAKNEIMKFSNSQEELFKNTVDTMLFFGSANYGKGLDIFLESILMNGFNDRLYIIASNLFRANFDIDEEYYIHKYKENKKNVLLINKFIPEETIKYLFSYTDYVALPYRDSYKYGTSSVFILASRYNKPVIVPKSLIPFEETVLRYGIGIVEDRIKFASIKPKKIEDIKFPYLTWLDNTRLLLGEKNEKESFEKEISK